MPPLDLDQRLDAALNKLAKWRSFFASWQLGTRPSDDAELKAVKDHREVTLMLRAEVSALTRLCADAGVFSAEALKLQLLEESQVLERMLEAKYPGWQATEHGMVIDLDKGAGKTMEGWKP